MISCVINKKSLKINMNITNGENHIVNMKYHLLIYYFRWLFAIFLLIIYNIFLEVCN